ncbi:Hypothetical protein, putative [Bodo saltans]|uniref:Uncharacterized protein n=1 Tax=Bodo saltans TaxID=75058 RepID=A0A0S4KQ79_BODSA|nr:Hypothetical protein, putative [Bodo saltans]|eukprot:CUI15083.1 Hypothetical protein, putative [Bodo saltans]
MYLNLLLHQRRKSLLHFFPTMPTFDAHVAFLNDVWGLNANTLPSMRLKANALAASSPVDPHFTVKKLNDYQSAGVTDFTPIVEQLVEMGPSINVLQQLLVYLNHSGHPTINVPKKKSWTTSSPTHAAAAEEEDEEDAAMTNLMSPIAPRLVALSNAAAGVVDADETLVEEREEEDRNGETPTGAEEEVKSKDTTVIVEQGVEDDADHGNNPGNENATYCSDDANEEEVLEICSPLRNPLLAPLAPPTADSRTLEMAMFVLWMHDITTDQLGVLEFVDPATIAVGVSVTVHNEILLMFGILRALLETGCEAVELLKFIDATDENGDASAPAATNEETALDAAEAQATAGNPAPGVAGGGGMDYITRKAVLNQMCLRFDLGDPLFWQPDSTMFFMMIHSFRMCYAMATDVDETITFSRGNITLSLDRVLLEVVNCSLQMPECLFGLANQMLVHQTLWLNIRGRLANPYDLIAMIPASNKFADNGADPRTVSDLIDTRPRGRFHTSCFNRSETTSNSVQDTNWRRVFAASLLVFAGGLWASRKANATFHS